jgi:hypothetical protein
MGQPGYCFKGGCHNASIHAGDLDMTPDDLLIARLLDVPAKFSIDCPGNVTCDRTAMTCAECAMCGTAPKVVVSTDAPGTGHIFDKIAPFIPGTTLSTMDIGCGKAMPTYNTTGTNTYTQVHKDCLVMFFTALARTPGTWPCTMPTAGGSGGTGGASTAGSGGT